MTPTQIIEKLFATSPERANLILGGLSILAAVAIFLSWKVDTDTAFRLGIYLLVLGFALAVLTAILGQGTLLKVLGWVLMTLVVVVLAILIYVGVVRDPAPFKPPECLLRPFEACEAAQDKVAISQSPAVTVKPIDATDPAAVGPDGGIDRSKFTTTVQFAGYKREDVVSLAQNLFALGWNISQPEKGGERTGAAGGYAEVRYRSTAEKAAADQLAKEINETGIKSGVKAVMNPLIKSGALEIWIGL